MVLELREQSADLWPLHGARSWVSVTRTRCCEELVFVFTVDSLGSGSMSTVVSGDVGPVTASGSGDIIVTGGSGSESQGSEFRTATRSLSALRVALYN